MPQRILGLDLGVTAVRAVLLESSYRSFTVTGVRTSPVPPGGEGAPPLRERQLAAAGRPRRPAGRARCGPPSR